MPSMLEARKVRMEYERRDGSKVLAIDDFTLDVHKGEFVSFVGPSGCGKTTFLKIVNGLMPPTSGDILLQGRPIEHSSRDRAMVFQEAALFPWFPLWRNIGYGLECAGMKRPEIRKRVKPYIELVGLSGFEDVYPYELSGGMQQRANLARALVVDPQVLLMDEPFAALDAQTREMMQAELLDVWGQTQKTVLFITHQINEAIYLSDRVLVVSARPGKILDDVKVDIPRPRGLDVKRSAAFRDIEDHVWRLIEEQARITMARTKTHRDEDGAALEV
ncbi:MAG TPA: ABC transporter ATP-binding protein [Candidatus Limnocylindria bacterium]|nr:ABC transporter ATP-binding protein [Candidatus Limnocylindria bacterium]